MPLWNEETLQAMRVVGIERQMVRLGMAVEQAAEEVRCLAATLRKLRQPAYRAAGMPYGDGQDGLDRWIGEHPLED